MSASYQSVLKRYSELLHIYGETDPAISDSHRRRLRDRAWRQAQEEERNKPGKAAELVMPPPPNKLSRKPRKLPSCPHYWLLTAPLGEPKLDVVLNGTREQAVEWAKTVNAKRDPNEPEKVLGIDPLTRNDLNDLCRCLRKAPTIVYAAAQPRTTPETTGAANPQHQGDHHES